MKYCLPLVLSILLGASLATAQPAPGDASPVVIDPTLRAVLETPRNTPDDYARALFALVDLGEPERALKVLEEINALNLDEAGKAKLVTEFGSASFVRLTLTKELGPDAVTFATSCLQAARAQAVAPERLASLVTQLSSDSPRIRSSALQAIERTGADGVAYLLQEIAAEKDAARNPLREALVALGPLAKPAIVAMLDSSDADLRKQGAWAVGRLGDQSAVPLVAAQAVLEPAGSDAGRAAQWAMAHLTGSQASSPVAIRLIDDALRNTRRGIPPYRPNAEGQIALYQRSSDGPLATSPVLLPSKQAGVVHAARLARLRLRLDPSSTAARTQALILHLEAQTLLEPANVTLADEPLLDASQIPSEQLSAALSNALELRYPGAATAIAVRLGDRGNAAVLITANGRPSPLAAALEASHPAVRWSALRAVRAMDPATPFPGSSRVADTLIHFAGGGNGRLAVVATPAIERSATLAGYLAGAGVEARITNNGTEAIKLANAADVEFVLLDLATLKPNVRETVFRLRRQTMTGGTPIGLLAPDGRLEEAKRIAKDHTGVLAFPRPHNAQAVQEIADALAAATPGGWPTAEERAELASIARGWIAEMLASLPEEGKNFYNLRASAKQLQQAVVRAGYTEESLATLGHLGTPESQRELLTAAGLQTLDINLRRKAAEGFEQSVQRSGVLLTIDEIKRQYDRYNASETADAETQQLLGSVLDVIELQRKKREQSAVGSRE